MNRIIFFFILTITGVNLQAQKGQLQFIENKNQWEDQIRFKSHMPNGAVFLTNDKLVFSFYKASDLEEIHHLSHEKVDVRNKPVNFHAYEVNFMGAKTPQFRKNFPFSAYHNYFLGNDPNKWASKVPLYENIIYQELYPNIDLSIYSKGSSFKYDFIVAPHGNPDVIQMNYKGVSTSLNNKGDLILKTSFNEITELAPYAYQKINGKEEKIECRFVLKNNILSYEFPKGYHNNLPLVIDPIMLYTTYSASTATTYGWSACYDNSGNLYSGGECFNTGWPVTTGAFQTSYGGNIDASINVYNPAGNALIYSTYYGGSAFDVPNSLVVNNNMELVICGTSSSTNLPSTTGCFDATANGADDIYIAHFTPNGTALIGATYVGGSTDDGDANHEVNFDSNGDIIVASNTNSTNFPVTAGAYQSTFGGGFMDGCFFKINPTCTNLLFSSFLGGSDIDYCKSIRQNLTGQYVVCGYTQSANYPSTPGTMHTTFLGGGSDGFLSVFSSNGNTLDASSFVGANTADQAFRVQIDQSTNNIYICGTSNGYTVSPGVYSNPGGNIFIDKINPTLTTSLLSTRIGSTTTTFSNLRPAAFLLDECDNVYVSTLGAGFGGNLPLSANAHQTTQGGFWLVVLEPNYANLMYASYMGAAGDHIDGGSSRFDPQGIVYQSVCTNSGTAYQFTGSWSPTKLSPSWDVASFKFDFEAAGVNSTAAVVNNDSVCAPGIIDFTNNSQGATSYLWDFGDGNFSTQVNPSHQYMNPGTYNVTLYAYNPSSCVSEDTSYLQVHVFDLQAPILQVKDTVFCDPNQVKQLIATVANYHSNMKIEWQPSGGVISGGNTLTPVIDPSFSTSYTLTVTDSFGVICKEISSATINISFGDTSVFKVNPVDTLVCPGEMVTFTAEGGVNYFWYPSNLISNTSLPVVDVTIYSEMYYNVDIVDQYGCKGTKQVHVDVFPLLQVDAGPEDIVRYGEGLQLQASGGSNFVWNSHPTLSSTTIPNPTVNPLEDTWYHVTGLDKNGCKAKDSVLIHVSNAIIPNAFTPNGDGKNDIFRFFPSSKWTSLKSFRIFDRWGKEMFYTDEARFGWDGKYEGKEMEVGVYFYLVEYNIGSKGYIEHGDFTLLR